MAPETTQIEHARGVSRINHQDRLEPAGDPPDLDETLTTLVAGCLIAVQPGTGESNEFYNIHPGVAATGRARAGKPFRDAVDGELAAHWMSVFDSAQGREGEDRTTGLVVRAGLGAAPYLMRREEWDSAASLLQDAFIRNPSRSVAAAILPALQAITATGQVPWAAGALARVLGEVDSAAAERQMRAVLDAAVARGDYQSASAAAGRLLVQCRASGRLAEALTLADEMVGYTRRAEFGPWTQLLDEVQRLQVLNQMGRAEYVLSEVQRLREHMRALPAMPDQTDLVNPWNVRETLFDTGREAALQLGRWNDALELNAIVTGSQQDRGAPATAIARAGFNDSGPLIRLGRIDEAMALLLECRQVFEDAHDVEGLAVVLTALASLEAERGHGDAAIGLAKDALRYSYLAGRVGSIAGVHHNLGNYLYRHARQPAEAFAHHLTSALIRALAGTGGVDESVRGAAADLRVLRASTDPPADVANLCRQVALVPGADLDRLLAGLASDPETGPQTLRELVARVRGLAAAPPTADPSQLAAWDPVIAAILAADSGDLQAAAALDAQLARYGDLADWSGLVAALRRLRAGQHGPDLLAGLDETGNAIVTRALDARNGTVTIPAILWPAMPLGPVLGELVAGAGGDTEAAGRARQVLDAMTKDPEWESLATALGRILDGDRDPELAAQLSDPTHQDIAATVLHHIGSADLRLACSQGRTVLPIPVRSLRPDHFVYEHSISPDSRA
jgi:tetratricopeptide (TPR) repeat protein